ncbi:MAG: GntR family transcriptional regulator [Acidobacteriota bacterium]
MLRIDPSDSVPLWKQIEEGVLRLVATGALTPEDPVASVREMARQLRVNPLTVSKAYRRLADAGVLTVRRGEGTFVSSTPPTMPEKERLTQLDEAALRYATQAKTLSADLDESLDAVHGAWRKLGPEPDDAATADAAAATDSEETP